MFFSAIAFTILSSEAHAADSLAGVQLGALVPTGPVWTAGADGSLSAEAQLGSVRGRVAVVVCENRKVSEITFSSDDPGALEALGKWMTSQGWTSSGSASMFSSQASSDWTKGGVKRQLRGSTYSATVTSADPGICYR